MPGCRAPGAWPSRPFGPGDLLLAEPGRRRWLEASGSGGVSMWRYGKIHTPEAATDAARALVRRRVRDHVARDHRGVGGHAQRLQRGAGRAGR